MKMQPITRTLHNGDVIATSLTHHQDGKVSIKRKVVARGIRPPKPEIALVAPSPPAQSPIPKRTKAAARNARKLAAAAAVPITAAPKTHKERTHHEHSTDKAAYVSTTNGVPKLLRRINARSGSHVESFQKDYELVGSDLRSANMDGAGGGGGGVAFPLAKVQAADRLRAFEATSFESFKWCEAVLIFNETPATIHKKGGPEHVVCSHLIRRAISDLADFYTPNRRRPDKTLAAIVKLVEEKRRQVKP